MNDYMRDNLLSGISNLFSQNTRKTFQYSYTLTSNLAQLHTEMVLEISWWNWDIEKITRNLEKIVGGDIQALEICE